MFSRLIILLVALSAIISAACYLLLPRHDEKTVQAKIEILVKKYDDSVYLNSDYKTAKNIANEIVELAEESNNPDAVKVRGLVRLAFTEIAFGKWGNKWAKNINTCRSLVSENPTVDRAEFLLYHGAIKGKWQRKFEKGLGILKESMWIANRVGDDRTLAIACMHASEIYSYLEQTDLVIKNAYHGATVAKHYGQKSIRIRTLRNLISNLLDLDKPAEASICADELVSVFPTAPSAKYAKFINGDSSEYADFVNSFVSSNENGDKKITRGVEAALGKRLKKLAEGHLRRFEFSECRKAVERAMPYLQRSGDARSLAGCERLLSIAQLEQADDVNKVDEIVETFGNQVPFAAVAAAYEKVGEKEKSLVWKERRIQHQNRLEAVNIGFMRQSSELFWESELRMREQAKISSELATKSNSRVRLLSMALILGMTVCGLLSCFYLLLRRERNSLDEIVKSRTKSLTKAMEDASAADRAKSDFLAQINHEIRNPLTAILGYCDLLASSNERSPEYVAGIESSSLHLRQLVDTILDVSKIESSGVEAKLREFFPAETSSDINEIMAELAAQQNLKFECSFQGDANCLILSDETMIRQIAINLIGNAIKFTEKGSVRASFELKQNECNTNATLIIDVKDTGVGISKDETETIFAHFAKGSNGKDRDGSGLGLFITRKLVKCLGGEIDLKSELGAGTHMKVNLPVKTSLKGFLPAESSVQAFNGQVEEHSEASTGDKVLVVDDQETIRLTLKLQLIAEGLRCETAKNLQETIELVENWQPDLVLLDLRMPAVSGFEVFEEIRQSKYPHALVYAMTGDATKEVEQKCFRSGFDGVITKPFQIHAITDILVKQQVKSNEVAF